MKIGEKIKHRRLELGWSQRELSKRMGYQNHSTITKIEAGKVDLPQSKVVKFAEVMGTSVAYLMNWDQVQKKNDTLSDIILKLQADDEFLSMVETLSKLDAEKRAAVSSVMSALSKADK